MTWQLLCRSDSVDAAAVGVSFRRVRKAGPETTPRIASGEGANLLEPGLEAIVLRRELPRASRLSGTGHWFEDFRLLYWQPLTPSGAEFVGNQSLLLGFKLGFVTARRSV